MIWIIKNPFFFEIFFEILPVNFNVNQFED